MLKVGDKARVKKNLEIGKIYGDQSFVDDMDKLLGKIITIKSLCSTGYKIEEARYTWTDEMLEPIALSTSKMIDAIQPGQQYKSDTYFGLHVIHNGYIPEWSNGEPIMISENFLSARWTLIPPEPKPVSFEIARIVHAKGKKIYVIYPDFNDRTKLITEYFWKGTDGSNESDPYSTQPTFYIIENGKWYIVED